MTIQKKRTVELPSEFRLKLENLMLKEELTKSKIQILQINLKHIESEKNVIVHQIKEQLSLPPHFDIDLDNAQIILLEQLNVDKNDK